MKTCYWFSKDFVRDVIHEGPDSSTAHLRPKAPGDSSFDEVREEFMSHAMDFALRERATDKTSDIRDLLLAKAFSESRVLEEQPQSVFGDALKEAKPNGMFEILSNS